MKKISMFLLTIVMVAFCVSCNSNTKQSEASKASTEETTLSSPEKEKKTIVCRVIVKEGQEAAFIDVAKTLVEATRKEPGNISYNLYQSPLDPKSFIFYEEYKDDDAFNFHANSDHFKAFADTTPNMLAAELNIEQF